MCSRLPCSRFPKAALAALAAAMGKRSGLASVVPLCAMLAAAVAGPALTAAADEPAEQSASATTAPPAVGDEVIVTAKSRRAIRAALIRAEDDLFAVYNSINGADEFDIHCYQEKRYESNISERICQPNFVRNDDAAYGQSLLHSIRGESGPIPESYTAEKAYKNSLMQKDWERLLKTHPELLGAVMKVAALQKVLADDETSSRHDRHAKRTGK